MQIHQLDSDNRQDIKKFIQFPYRLYKDQSGWVPPLQTSTKAILEKKHPVYGRADIAFYLAEDNGEVVGQLAVVNNHPYNAYTGKEAAFFSFFDCIDDVEVSEALFEAAFDWARKQGLKRILGPKGLSGSDPGGVLMEGFEHSSVMTVPYNYPYYDKLITHSGFEKATDHLSGILKREEYQLPEKVNLIAERVMERQGFTLQKFKTIDDIRPWVEAIKKAHRDSFILNHEFYPPTEEEYNETIETLLQIADPKILQVVTKGDKVVAFILAYPDVSDGFRKAKGHLYPFGWLHLLHAKKNSKVIMVNGLAIIPEYRGRGTNAMMYLALQNAVFETDYQRLEAVMVNETNFTSKSDNETLGVQWYKRHRSYKKELY
jgi:hypothetical protein